jgi:NAD(P)-dependent dehydrogenase (short-subunit alcohol dehydrogenase family)
MKVIAKSANLLSRITRTVKLVRKFWKVGGATQVNIAQISHGEILRGKTVLITGGSAGIGLAIAKKCLSEGAEVIVTGRSAEKLEAAQEGFDPQQFKTLVWDVSDISIRDERINEAFSLAGGKIDVLINNAGVLLPQSFFSTTEEIWNQTYSVNSKGVFFITQGFSERWIRKKQNAKVINIASTGGFLGATQPYRMTKWDIVGLTAGLGTLLSPQGIIVNGIAPGRIATEMLGRGDQDNVYDTMQPLKRMGVSEEIAELAAFMMSDACNYIVGQTIICDGGYSLKS